MAIKADVQTQDKLLRKLDELDEIEGSMLAALSSSIDSLAPLKIEMQQIKDETKKSILLIDGEMLNDAYAGEQQLRKTLERLGLHYVD